MGGAGPYVEFSIERDAHYKQTGLPELSINDLDGIWSRARAFIEREVVSPLIGSGWVENRNSSDEDSNDRMSNIGRSFYSPTGLQSTYIIVPSRIQVLFDKRHQSVWENAFRLNARRPNRETYSMYIHTDFPSISNLVYLIQLIVPGAITLVREEEYDELGDETTWRILPAMEWIERYKGDLITILGEERFKDVLGAATDVKTAFRRESYPTYDYYNSDSEAKDFAACDRECGYCGHCDY